MKTYKKRQKSYKKCENKPWTIFEWSFNGFIRRSSCVVNFYLYVLGEFKNFPSFKASLRSSKLAQLETYSKIQQPTTMAIINLWENFTERRFSFSSFTSLRLMLLLRYEAWKLLKFEYLLSIVNPHNLRFASSAHCWY